MAEKKTIEYILLKLTPEEYDTILDAMVNCNCRSTAIENKQIALLRSMGE